MADDVSAVAAPARELHVEGLREVTRGLLIAGESPGDVHVPDDGRRGVSPLGCVVEQRGGAEGVIVVPVRVDDVPDGVVADRPQLAHDARTIHEKARVDHGHAVDPDHERGVAKAGQQVDARGDLAPGPGGEPIERILLHRFLRSGLYTVRGPSPSRTRCGLWARARGSVAVLPSATCARTT